MRGIFYPWSSGDEKNIENYIYVCASSRFFCAVFLIFSAHVEAL